MTEEDKCWVCLRITPEIVLKKAHVVWSTEPIMAREIANKSSHIIKESYQRNPTGLCGKPAKSLLSGLFYLLSYEANQPIKQKTICDALNICGSTLRKAAVHWKKKFPDYFPSFYISRSTFYERVALTKGSINDAIRKAGLL